ncbi:Urb2/Npa2 family-domain-containing protein [Daedaleopsis nitida]|nr:Urb2/Npa2 family-domain-containing protein [Daedaleopsis nitida]
MHTPQNAQDFIRALKASSDPPHAGGPLKVDIARQAWDDAHLYVPNKAEAIVDWLLSRLLKDKSRERSHNPTCDTRYWQLLLDILIPSDTAKAGDYGRATRAWLVPLLNRIPVAPILLSYLDLLSIADYIDAVQCSIVFRCMSFLWPLAVPKFNPETLLECFGAVLQLGMSSSDVSEASCGKLHALNDLRMLTLVVTSYRTSLSNSTAKKKLYTLFLKRYLPFWLRLVADCCRRCGQQPSLVADIYNAGIETMFGLDIIKQTIDHRQDTALSEALTTASAEHSGLILRTLPRLFESYVQNVKRHKGSLFSQGSNQAPGHVTEQVQREAMVFYASCASLARSEVDNASWRCRVALLEVVEKENLLNMRDEEAKGLLRKEGDLAVEGLACAWDERSSSLTESAMRALATLARIDFDLISASLPMVFPRLIATPNTVSPALQYLVIVLDYNSKTRNLPHTIVHISEAFSVHHLERIPGGAEGTYELASAGPFTSLSFLDDLSRAVRNFLTPGQVLETIGDVGGCLRDAYARFLEREAKQVADRGDGPRKKRKKDAALPAEDHTELGYQAASFALVARAMVVVLRSLPLHTLTDNVQVEAEQLIGDVYTAVAARAVADALGRTDRTESWAWQVVLAGALHLHYGLARAPGLNLQVAFSQDLSSVLLSCVSSGGIRAELVVEILQTLMHQCSIGAFAPESVLDRTLDYLEEHLEDDAVWTGKSHSLKTHGAGGIAVLHVVVDRWLPGLEAWANPKQLQRLASILVNANDRDAVPRSSLGLSVYSIISRLLHDAQFWELIGLRGAFLAQLLSQTAPLEGVQFSKHLASTSPPLPVDVVASIAHAYEVVLCVPQEYLPRTLHNELLKRGFAADVVVLRTRRHSKGTQLSARHSLVIREVLRRTISYLGAVDNIVSKDFLYYLLDQESPDGDSALAGEELSAATMKLVDIYQRSMVRAAKKGSAESVVELVTRFSKIFADGKSGVGMRASLLLIDSIVTTGTPSDFSEDCLDAIRTLHEQMLAYSAPRLSSGTAILEHVLLDVWSHLQVLGRWLIVNTGSMPTLGRQLSSSLLSWKGDQRDLETLAPVVLAILLGELQKNEAADYREHAEYMVIAFVALARICGTSGTTILETRMTSACRTMPTEVFSTVLDIVYDGLPLEKGLAVRDIASLIRFSATLLLDAPEGTSKICQAHTARCQNLFADDSHFISLSMLRSEVLNFLVRQCNDRPASLRSVDLSSIWSILRASMAGSLEHEQSTDATAFHDVVNVLGALVRLRRDLVLHTLPHLGFILRQLVSCLRSVRPQLGGKQSRIVMDTLPQWIAAAQPLASTEGKALARLLTTLTTKTMVRVHGPAADAQKPESLVRPFSKHAAYVLTAYIEAVNDPLCFMSAGVRKELQPGLFELCDMLGEHNRDAMMVSALDAGGKATMKSLWKEYEKQRYVGKG